MRSRAEAGDSASDDRTFLRAFGLGLGLLLGLYLAFPDKVYVFDGIMFSDVIERNVDDWRSQALNERHLLFNPLLMSLRDLLGRLGTQTRAYPLIQKVNAVAGILGLIVFFRLLERIARDRAVAAAATLLLAVTAGYWSRASEGQVYMLMVVGALGSAWSAFRLLEKRTAAAAALLSAFFALSVLLHAANLVLAPMALFALWTALPRAYAVLFAALGAAAIALPYIRAFGLWESAAAIKFLTAATGGYTPGQVGSLSGIAAYFLSRDNPVAVLPAAGWQSILAWPWPGVLAAAGGWTLAAAALSAAVWLWRKRPEAHRTVIILALLGVPFVALDAVWHGGVFFWTVPCAAALAVAALAACQSLGPAARLRLPGLLAALGVLLGAWNLALAIIPQSKIENNVGYRRALFVRDHTAPSSWILLSGYGFPNAKVYLPYFAQRAREVLEFYLERYPRGQALGAFARFLKGNREAGVPMYLLSDLVTDKDVERTLQDRWGVRKAEVIACFGPGRLIGVAREDPSFEVFLFVPRDEAPQLFSVLSYSLLTESEPARLRETAEALEAIARGMTSGQRRSVPALMRESEYGARLLIRGFSPYMSAESRARAEERARTYAEWRKTPTFHLRMGNLYSYLGLSEEARREWSKLPKPR